MKKIPYIPKDYPFCPNCGIDWGQHNHNDKKWICNEEKKEKKVNDFKISKAG